MVVTSHTVSSSPGHLFVKYAGWRHGLLQMTTERRADVLAPGWTVTPGLSLAEARDVFLQDLHNAGRSVKTVGYYDYQLSKFLDWLASERRVCDLNGLDARCIGDFFGHERDRGLVDNSVHAAARAIRAWINYLVRTELLPDSPMRKVKMPKKGRHILPSFTKEKVQALLGACRQNRDRALILFLIDSGVRAAECVKLNIGDVNLRNGAVLVRGGKGDKDRRTNIGQRSRRALAAYLAERPAAGPGDALWVGTASFERISDPARRARAETLPAGVDDDPARVTTYTGDRLTASGLRILTTRLGRRAGVEPCGPHAFRRTCAVTMHRDGARLTEIAGLLGHSDLPTLQRYLDLQAADFADAHSRHGPVDRWEL